MTDVHSFSVRSESHTEGYIVTVKQHDGRMICICDCPAGKFGKLCKHKIAIFIGDDSILQDVTQASQLVDLVRNLKNGLIDQSIKRLIEAELEVESAKKKVGKIRRDIEKMISE